MQTVRLSKPYATAEVSEKMEYRIDGLVAAFSEAVAETDERAYGKIL